MSLGSSRLIQASAGTGKTFALSGQFISLLLAGEDPSTILASTFTRKAAGEILERIYLRLARAMQSAEARQQLAEQANLNSLSTNQIQSALISLVKNQHQLRVSTLDSFASSIARLFAEELGLPSNWGIQDEPSAHLQLSLAVAAVCSSIKSDQVASLVTTLRRGESSRSISNAIRNIVGELMGVFQETSYEHWSWLSVPRPSANEKKELLEQLRLADLPMTKAGKVNQKVFSAVEKLINLIDEENWPSSLEGALLQNTLKGVTTFSAAQLSEQLVTALQKIGILASQHCLNRLGDANRAAYGLLYAVVNELQLAEEISGKISFDRIIRRLVKLGNSLFSNEFYFRLDTKLHHVLLDEFQDTSLLQWQLLEPLIEEKVSSVEITSSFFCVGDGKQGIYGWREGDVAIFDSIPVRWPQIELQTLETSYRSQPEVINAVNKVFLSLNENSALEELSPAVTSWLSRFKEHSTVARAENLNEYSNVVSFGAVETESDSEEYGCILMEKIKNLATKNPTSSIGILVRGNKDITKILDLAQTHNFELSAQGGTPLTRFPVVTALLALLSLTDNPGHSIKQFEVMASPWCKQQDFSKLLENTKRDLLAIGLTQTLQNLCEQRRAIFESSEQQALDQLLYLAIKHELSNPTVDLSAFINVVEGSAVEDIKSTNVQVLTIHKSKGLEFDIVVIPDLSWSLKPKDNPDYLLQRDPISLRPVRISLPDKQSLRVFSKELSAMAQQKYQDDFEESLSLLYVALTRAKSSMHLFCPKSSLTGSGISAASLIAFAIPPEPITLTGGSHLCDRYEETSNLSGRASTTLQNKLKKPPSFPIIKSQQKLRGLGRVSPSSFVDHDANSAKNKDAELFGTLIHKLFSITPWLEDCLPTEELVSSLQSLGVTAAQSKHAVEEFKGYLAKDNIAGLLKKPADSELNSTKIYAEKSFIFREGNLLLQGRIDRLVVGPGSGTVIDFKVGKTADSKRLEGYMKQLAIYKKASSILFPGTEFKAVLLFLGDGNRIMVE